MLDQLIELDHQLFLYLNNLGIKKFDFFWIIMSNKILNFICYSIILYLIYIKRGFKTSTFIFSPKNNMPEEGLGYATKESIVIFSCFVGVLQGNSLIIPCAKERFPFELKWTSSFKPSAFV